MHLREFLTDTHAYMPPASALAGLEDEAANRRLPGTPHSVAEIVAHLNFWQNWFLKRCRGIDAPMAGAAAEGWPAVESWDVVRGQFLEGLTEAALLSEAADHPLEPAIEFPPMANYTVHQALAHIAVHNAHHLGQVVTLRQLMGQWPPPAGSWTW